MNSYSTEKDSSSCIDCTSLKINSPDSEVIENVTDVVFSGEKETARKSPFEADTLPRLYHSSVVSTFIMGTSESQVTSMNDEARIAAPIKMKTSDAFRADTSPPAPMIFPVQSDK